MTIFIDKRGALPLELILLIGQAAPVELSDLNGQGLADTFWIGADGKSWTYELKQVGELMMNLDNIEEQLSHQWGSADELGLLVAGVVVPCDGGCKILNWSGDGRSGYLSGVRGGGPYRMNYDGYRAKLAAWQVFGITVTELPTKLALARHIVALYNWCMKPAEQHRTFKVPIKPKLQMPTGNPYELTIQGFIDPATGRTFIGPDRARTLMDAFGSPAEMFDKTAKEIAAVAGIGPKTAEGILRAVGRGD